MNQAWKNSRWYLQAIEAAQNNDQLAEVIVSLMSNAYRLGKEEGRENMTYREQNTSSGYW